MNIGGLMCCYFESLLMCSEEVYFCVKWLSLQVIAFRSLVFSWLFLDKFFMVGSQVLFYCIGFFVMSNYKLYTVHSFGPL